MPYPTEHACRVKDPDGFIEGSFRRITREHEGKTYAVIIGKLKGETATTEQAYRYPKDTWTARAARAHCKDHGGRFEAAGPVEDAVVGSAGAPCAGCGQAGAGPTLDALLAAAAALERGPAPRLQPPPPVELRAQADDSADLYLYDIIGGWFGINAGQVVTELRSLRASTLRVHINSPGGDVFDGLAIYNALKRWAGGTVETLVEGLAGSIAGVIALAGRTVTMAPASFFMIHDPHGVAIGGAERMRHMAGLLDQTGSLLADVYAEKTGAPLAEVRTWMRKETWYTAAEALTAGFADALLEADPVEARAAAAFDLSAYAHVPAALARPTPSKPPASIRPPRPRPAPAREQAAALAHSFGHLVGV